MKNLYLVLTILGAVVPYLFFFQFIQTEGLDVAAFNSAMFVNGAAGGISAVILTSSVFSNNVRISNKTVSYLSLRYANTLSAPSRRLQI